MGSHSVNDLRLALEEGRQLSFPQKPTDKKEITQGIIYSFLLLMYSKVIYFIYFNQRRLFYSCYFPHIHAFDFSPFYLGHSSLMVSSYVFVFSLASFSKCFCDIVMHSVGFISFPLSILHHLLMTQIV